MSSTEHERQFGRIIDIVFENMKALTLEELAERTGTAPQDHVNALSAWLESEANAEDLFEFRRVVYEELLTMVTDIADELEASFVEGDEGEGEDSEPA